MKRVIDIPEGMLDELRTCKFPVQEVLYSVHFIRDMSDYYSSHLVRKE